MAKTAPLTIPSSKVVIALAAGSTDAGMKSADAKAGKLWNVPIASIKPIEGFNVRVDTPDYRAHRDMLADSMRANGFDPAKPLAGFVAKEGEDNVIYVTDGYTRLDAANQVNQDEGGPTITTLPVLVRSPAPSLTDLTVALHTNNTGRPLTPFELGVVVKRLLKEDGADKAGVAKRLAVTPRYLDDVLLLVNSPKAVRTAVLEGDVSSTMAIQQLRKAGDNPEKAAEAITAAVTSAKAKGKKKATAKDTGPKMVTVKHTVSIAAGTDMKEIVKAVAAHVRAAVAAVPHATDPEAKVADTDGTISLSIQVPAPLTTKAAPKAKATKPAKTKPAAEEPPVKGAVEVTSEGIDDEPVKMPPAVKNGEGVDDEEVDI